MLLISFSLFEKGASCFIAKGSPCMFEDDEFERESQVLVALTDAMNIYPKVILSEALDMLDGEMLGMIDLPTYDVCDGE